MMTKLITALAAAVLPVCASAAEAPISIPEKPATSTEVQTPREEQETAVQAKQGTVSGNIVGVNTEERTIVVNDAEKGLQKMHIEENTKLRRNGQDAGWADLKMGAKVKAQFREEKATAQAQSIEVLAE